jgi:hypothetical protein
MKFTLDIPAIPPTLNQLMRRHWGYRVWEIDRWGKWMAGCLSGPQRSALLAAKGRRLVTLTVWHRGTWDDADNAQSAYKVILDAGKKLGWWADDTSEFVQCAPVAQQRVSKAKDFLARLTIEVAE